MEWLSDLTNWIKDQVLSVWNAVCAFFHDIGIWFLQTASDITLAILNAIPVPSWLTDYSFGTLFASLPGDWLPWIASTFNLPACFAVLGLGVLGRLIRKALTLGQW